MVDQTSLPAVLWRELRDSLTGRGGRISVFQSCCACLVALPARGAHAEGEDENLVGGSVVQRGRRNMTIMGENTMEESFESSTVWKWEQKPLVQLEEEPEDIASAADDDPYGEAGQPCGICSSETRYNTHLALPCRHTACESCWTTWLKEHKTCMICCKEVERTVRFSKRLVPLQAHEIAGSAEALMYSINTQLEDAVSDLVQAMVDIKSRLQQVSDHLEEIESHLDAGSMRRMGADARGSVAVVEAAALTEQLRVLAAVMFGAEDARTEQEGCAWRGVWGRIGGVGRAIERVGEALDSHHAAIQQHKDRGIKFNDGPLAGLETTRRLLQGCTVGTIQGQWRPAEGLVRGVVGGRVPAVMGLLEEQGALTHGAVALGERLERRAREVVKRTEGGLARLLPEFELMLIRVQSCFDYGQ